MSLHTRLNRLESGLHRGDGPCPGGITTILAYCPDLGQREPEIPPDAARCPLCGEPHVLVIREEIVQPQQRENQ